MIHRRAGSRVVVFFFLSVTAVSAQTLSPGSWAGPKNVGLQETLDIAVDRVTIEEGEGEPRVEKRLEGKKARWRFVVSPVWKAALEKMNVEDRGWALTALAASYQTAANRDAFSIQRKDGTFVAEYFIAFPGSAREYSNIIDRPLEFNDWLFEGINQSADGSSFFLVFTPFQFMKGTELGKAKGKFTRCAPQATPPVAVKEKTKKKKTPVALSGRNDTYPYALTLPFRFSFLTFDYPAAATFVLGCKRVEPGWSEWSIYVEPSPWILKGDARGVLVGFDDTLTLGMLTFELKPPAWVYEILPLPIVKNQVGERLTILLRNLEKRRKQMAIGSLQPGSSGGESPSVVQAPFWLP